MLVFSNIFLNKDNLLHNVTVLEQIAGGKLCVMVKANAYGHGAKEIVGMLEDRIDFFGVSNQSEAEEIRGISNSKIIVFAISIGFFLSVLHRGIAQFV